MNRKILFGTIMFIIILLIIVLGSYLWKNRYCYIKGESLNYNVKSDEISKISFRTLGRSQYNNSNYYVLDEQGEIDDFLNVLNDLKLIKVKNDFDLDILSEDRRIAFTIYEIDGYSKHNTIIVYDKYVIVIYKNYDKIIAQYVIKGTLYDKNADNIFNKFINDKYLDVETTNAPNPLDK